MHEPSLRDALRRHKALSLVALMIMIAAIARVYARLFYGVDFTDESLYASFPYRILLGEKPFIDEILVQQSAGFLTLPLVWLYLKIVGSLNGLLLMLRLASLLLLVAIALGIARFTMRWIGLMAGAMLGGIVILGCSTDLMTFSYNFLGMTLLTAGLFLLCESLLAPVESKPFRLLAAGCILGCCFIAYPPLGVTAPFTLAGLFVLRGRLAIKPAALLVGGILLPTVPFALYLLHIGLAGVFESVAMYADLVPKGGGLVKLLSIQTSLTEQLAALPRGDFIFGPVTAVGLVSAIIVTVLIGLLAAMLHGKNPQIKAILLLIWLPSLVGGLTTAYISDIGLPATVVGLFAGFMASLLLILFAAQLSWPKYSYLLWLLPLIFIVRLDSFVKDHIYREQPAEQLTERVSSGVFAGLWTSPWKKAFVSSLQTDLAALTTGDIRLLFYNDFPAGVLLGDDRLAICAAWVYSSPRQSAETRRPLLSCVKRMADRPVLAVKSKLNLRSATQRPAPALVADPLEEMLRFCTDKTEISSPMYEITRIRDDCLRSYPVDRKT